MKKTKKWLSMFIVVVMIVAFVPGIGSVGAATNQLGLTNGKALDANNQAADELAEEVVTTATYKDAPTEKPKADTILGEGVETGDDTPLILFGVLMVLALVGLVTTLVLKKRKSNK